MSKAADPANRVYPLHGSTVSRGAPELTARSTKDAVAQMPHIVEALAPAPVPAARMDDTYDAKPDFAVPGPAAPRM